MAEDAVVLSRAIREQGEELAQLEQQFDALRRAYERFFSGVESREPNRQRAQFERAMRLTRLPRSHRSEIRFRMATLTHRVASYSAYWDRLLRQLEEGALRREGFGRFMAPDAQEPPEPSREEAATGTGAAAVLPPPLLEVSSGPDDISVPPPPSKGLVSKDLYREYMAACQSIPGAKPLPWADFVARVGQKFAGVEGRPGVRLAVRVEQRRVTLVVMRAAEQPPAQSQQPELPR